MCECVRLLQEDVDDAEDILMDVTVDQTCDEEEDGDEDEDKVVVSKKKQQVCVCVFTLTLH